MLIGDFLKKWNNYYRYHFILLTDTVERSNDDSHYFETEHKKQITKDIKQILSNCDRHLNVLKNIKFENGVYIDENLRDCPR